MMTPVGTKVTEIEMEMVEMEMEMAGVILTEIQTDLERLHRLMELTKVLTILNKNYLRKKTSNLSADSESRITGKVMETDKSAGHLVML